LCNGGGRLFVEELAAFGAHPRAALIDRGTRVVGAGARATAFLDAPGRGVETGEGEVLVDGRGARVRGLNEGGVMAFVG
jgi:hypothetical protein